MRSVANVRLNENLLPSRTNTKSPTELACNSSEQLAQVEQKIIQKIAIAFGGELTPPGMFNGMLVRKKEYLCSSAHVLDRASRSNISPL